MISSTLHGLGGLARVRGRLGSWRRGRAVGGLADWPVSHSSRGPANSDTSIPWSAPIRAKESSYGPREQGLAARAFYTESQTVLIMP